MCTLMTDPVSQYLRPREESYELYDNYEASGQNDDEDMGNWLAKKTSASSALTTGIMEMTTRWST